MGPLLASCATTIPQTGGVTLPPSTSPAAWDVELKEATRRVEPYDWFMRQADLRATLITPRLRKAFLDEREHFHGRFADETQRELIGLGTADEGVDAKKTLSKPESEEQVLVFVAMYAADQKNRDLSASYTIWDTALVRGDKRVKPVSIENVRASPAVREVFPYIDRFDDLYLFRFPLVEASSGTALFGPGPQELHLEVKSALAECVVSWTLQGT
jgi:hypothetical protein